MRRPFTEPTEPQVPHLDGNQVSELEGKSRGTAPLPVELASKRQSDIHEADAQSPVNDAAELAADPPEKSTEMAGSVRERPPIDTRESMRCSPGTSPGLPDPPHEIALDEGTN
jgi:hypothetical protein